MVHIKKSLFLLIRESQSFRCNRVIMSTTNAIPPRRDANGEKTAAWTTQLKAKQNEYIHMRGEIRRHDAFLADAYDTALWYVSDLLFSRNAAEDEVFEKEFRAQFRDVEWVENLPDEGSVICLEELKNMIADIKRVGTPTKCLVTHRFGLVKYDLEGGDEFDKAIEKEESEKLHRTDGRYYADFDATDYKKQRADKIAQMMKEIQVADEISQTMENVRVTDLPDGQDTS
jgi:hypothetical protein